MVIKMRIGMKIKFWTQTDEDVDMDKHKDMCMDIHIDNVGGYEHVLSSSSFLYFSFLCVFSTLSHNSIIKRADTEVSTTVLFFHGTHPSK